MDPRTPATTSAPPSPAPARRLGWLDALRGVGALAVVFEHGQDYLFPGLREVVGRWIDPGTFGVMVFFLVSGYIIPASLERRGDLRGFWVSRVFRLYPLLFLAIGGILLISPLVGLVNSFERAGTQLPFELLGHLTMLEDLFGGPNVLGPLWTLSYEMIFYLMVTALFAVGLHRRSTAAAVSLAAGTVLCGIVVPTSMIYGSPVTHHVLGHAQGPLLVAMVFVAAIGGSLGLILAGGPRLRPLGAGALLVTAMGLALVNSQVQLWEGLTILATMFAGTAIYRAEQGQIAYRTALLVVTVPAAALLAGFLFPHPWAGPNYPLTWATAVGGAWLFFLFGMLVLRRLAMPRPLVWLGTVSYSVYLLHKLVLYVVWYFMPHPLTVAAPIRLGVSVLALAVLFGICQLSHRYVEVPAQNWGRRINKRRQAAAAPAPAAAARAALQVAAG